MENDKEDLCRGLASDGRVDISGANAPEEDAWRQGESSKDSMGNIEEDAPDDEIADNLIELSTQFSADLKFVRGVPRSMLHEFTL